MKEGKEKGRDARGGRCPKRERERATATASERARVGER